VISVSVKIIQDYIPKGRKNRPGYAMAALYITIHQTGNTSKGADAKAHAAYLKGSTAAAAPVSWHFTVDDKVIYQHLPVTENGWHAGDGTNGPGNRTSIGIEICINKDGNLSKAEANAAWLVAKLTGDVKTLKAFPGCMKQHYNWSGKNCPAQIRGRKNGWSNFLKAVESNLKTKKPAATLGSVDRIIGVEVDGKKVAESGVFYDGATYVKASYIVGLIGGNVTGHGDHIKIALPKIKDTKKLESELTSLKLKIKNAQAALL